MLRWPNSNGACTTLPARGQGERHETRLRLVERMQRQIDYHLARARATAAARAALGLRCSVLPSVEGLVHTMRRRGIRVLFAGVQPTVRHAIRDAGILEEHTLFPTVEEALKRS